MQENEVASSSDLVCTSKEETPALSKDEVTVHVQSGTSSEESHSTTETVQVSQTLSRAEDKPVDLSTKKSDSDSSESTQGKVRVMLRGFFEGNFVFLWISLSSVVAVLWRSSTNTELETLLPVW